MADIHYFGIRHHGPGCSARLISALDKLKPNKVLIEGPSDCSELLTLLAHAQMQPPVALLAYATEYPECHFYYPFAEFSPEYQACLWAVKHGVEVAFIDVPTNIKLAQSIIDLNEEPDTKQDDVVSDKTEANSQITQIIKDPIGVLARLGGYEDGESWWNDLLEQSYIDGDDLAVFASVAQAMNVLRQRLFDEGKTHDEDEVREAYMRQEIVRHAKNADSMAVVCGAWHIPALDPNHALLEDGKPKKFTSKTDNALIKTLPKKLAATKVKNTWIPWTSPRLASDHYGAGVSAPKWYAHLWQNRFNQQINEHWLTKVASALRESGQIVSTASVIEAVRLANTLAVVRGRPSVGFEELSEATVACLCFGEKILWQQVADALLMGKDVGKIPDNLPLAPLLEDLQRLQKQTKLAPEALAKEIQLDLRSEIGLKKSLLLHRLNILGVPWGTELGARSSRGTFRENWSLQWKPEYAVALVENLVYGNTIYEASGNKLIEIINQNSDLSYLAHYIQQALEAGLEHCAMVGLSRLSEQATHTDNALALIKSISPLVHLQRYGTARQMALDKVGDLIDELTVKASIALPYAIKNINDEEAEHYHQYISEAHEALKLCQNDELMVQWWQAFEDITQNIHACDLSNFLVGGLVVRLLYQSKKMDTDALSAILQKTLSPAITTSQSAKFFEGFFEGAVEHLMYDELLLSAVEAWLIGLDENEFVEYLPLFRRVFSVLDSHERKRFLDKIFGAGINSDIYLYYDDGLEPIWQKHLTALTALLKG